MELSPYDRRALARLMAGIVVDPVSGCWIWQKNGNSNGQGLIAYKPPGQKVRTLLVYRLSYELHRGPIPQGAKLDHQCHNEDLACPGGRICRHRRCANPWHVEPSTTRENLLRGKGPTARKAAQTECIRGHPFTPENTYIKPNGCRECRICIGIRNRRRYQREDQRNEDEARK